MIRLSHWKIFTLALVLAFTAACSGDESPAPSNTDEPLVAFDFTPVPTSTNASSEEEGNTETLDAEEYTVQMDNAVVVLDETTEGSAEIASDTIDSSTGERDETSQTSKRVDLIDRDTLVNSITDSRNAISNLTYAINVADGVGTLSCAEVVEHYEQILTFEQYNVTSDLHVANTSYSRALNMVTAGTVNLYDFCATHVGEGAYNDEIEVREITPASIWEQALAESNASIRSAENAVGWLKGDARLLSGVYDQFRQDLTQYQNALSNPVLDLCPDIRSAFERIVIDSIILSINDSATYNSYSSYRLAVDSINDTGIGLYEFCDVNVGGAGQMNENNSQLLPQGLIDTASIGREQASNQVDTAYSYIESSTDSAAGDSGTGDSEAAQTVWTTGDETALPVNLFVVSIQQSSQPHLWEIVLGFDPNGGTAPYTLLTDGVINDNNTVMLVQTCDRNYRDSISLRDSAGLLFRSEIIEVQRSGVCGL